MKKYVLYFILFGLVVANTYAFVSSIYLGNEISRLEKDTKTYHQENIELERKATALNSLQHAASMAAELRFTKIATPVYLDNLTVAMNK
jgi:hypothetical protein